MGFSRYNIRRKVNAMLGLFILMGATGIVYMLSKFSIDIIYQQISLLIILLIIWAAAVIFIKLAFQFYFARPLKKLLRVSKLAADGDLSQKVDYRVNDEIGQISLALDRIIQNQESLADFSEKLGDGNFEVDLPLLGDNDKLGHAITGMRDKLQKVVEENTKRNWISEGLAKFGEILRTDAEDFREVCDALLSELVKYLKANQGAIFMVNEDDNSEKRLELLSSYAWKRKKYLARNIEIGEGLIGQAAIEKDTIYVTDVPPDYISITSGLGDANPRSILIVPLLFNEEVMGAVEVASFKPLEQFEIEFMEKLAEIMASTISTVRTNERTQQLLRESQKLTEEMRAQEEEMRQNLEEMNATQEEMQLREVERIGIFTAINNTLATVEFSMEGSILSVNDKFLDMMQYSLEEIENKTDRIFTDKSKVPIEEYKKFWKELREGKLQQGDYKRLTRSGVEIWVNASYTPALDKDGKPYKVIMLAQDITEKKKAELEAERQAEELRVQGEKLKSYTAELEDIKQNLSEKLEEASRGLKQQIKDIESEKAKNIAVLEGCVDGVISFNQDGGVEYFNKSAEEIWGIKREAVIGEPVRNLIPISLEENGNGLTAYVNGKGKKQELDVRTEVSLSDSNENEIDLLLTLTRAKLENEMTFTIFAQKISVDLF